MQPLTILKIGGKLLDDEKQLSSALADFANISTKKILVHGGGKRANELCRQIGIQPNMWNGRRLTDAPTLEVVTMVYAGLINKQVVALLQSLQCNAMGFSGTDGNLIYAKKRAAAAVDFGYAGDVEKVNTHLLMTLLKNGITPVFCAITHDGKGQLLNTNADTIATELAAALTPHFAITLKYCFEKKGVLLHPQDDSSFMDKIDMEGYQQFKDSGIISAGMIPKLDNAFTAKKAQVDKVVICGTSGIKANEGTEIC
ncbi:MAG: acetylglutamate kinase [Bacteroidota bacterium]